MIHVLCQPRPDLWAVAKPAGVAVHKGAPETPHMGDWMAARGLAPCHRLDLGTSGALLCARDPAVRGEIGKLFEAGAVRKTYLAVVFGQVRPSGVVRRPLKDARRGRAVEAVTRYRCAEDLGGFSLVEVVPETGRKHQIRRHLQGMGHSVVGDERYPPRGFRPVPGWPLLGPTGQPRIWLHAARLELPGLEVEAPLPPELSAHLDLLRGHARVSR